MKMVKLVEIKYRNKTKEVFHTDESLNSVLSKARTKGEIVFFHWKPLKV